MTDYREREIQPFRFDIKQQQTGGKEGKDQQ